MRPSRAVQDRLDVLIFASAQPEIVIAENRRGIHGLELLGLVAALSSAGCRSTQILLLLGLSC